ncbi:MAG TPA: DEAD/DEAH box helicase [Parasulfuritortus sp.]
MKFSDLGLAEEIVRAVTEHGYTTPTPIQAQAIPAVLSGGDLMAGAQTGTGKTAGFVLPILQRLIDRNAQPAGRSPIRALILTPTRELAAQVEESVKTYGKYTKLSSMAMFGGVSINPQIQRLRSRLDILVATPGRLLDHVQQKTIDLSQVQTLVLDEADRMLDMGFIKDIKKILALLPKQRQNLLFSATFSDEIKTLADGLLTRPTLIEVARRNATADTIAQKVYEVNRDQKRQVLTHLIKTHQWFQVLVFTRTKHGANRLAEQLEKDGIPAMAIHGNKSQGARTRALAEFKSGKLQVLVATDIAARGIDISELPHVVNYELPNIAEDYVHRIGRTGRAGAEGEATSLVCVDEFDYLRGIERLIKRSLPREILPGFEPDPNAKAQPIQLRSPDHQPGRGRGGNRQGKPNPSGSGADKARSGQGKPRNAGPKPAAAEDKPAKQAGARPGPGGQPKPKARPGGEVTGKRPSGGHHSGQRHR